MQRHINVWFEYAVAEYMYKIYGYIVRGPPGGSKHDEQVTDTQSFGGASHFWGTWIIPYALFLSVFGHVGRVLEG
jgi:hypothetical protein